jgi:beta-lactamase superfamily II metal-dependent hydrolase
MNEKNQRIIVRQSKIEIQRLLFISLLMGIVFSILLLTPNNFAEWIALENEIAISLVWVFNLVITGLVAVLATWNFWHDLVSKVVVCGDNVTIKNNHLKSITLSFEDIGKIKYTAYSNDDYKKTEKYAVYSKSDEMIITITGKWRNIKKLIALLEEREVPFEEVPRKNKFGYKI